MSFMQQPAAPQYQEHVLTTRPKTEAASVTAFILAITSFFIPFVTSLVALALASGGRRNIAGSDGRRGGRGLANAATVMALISLVLWTVGSLLLLFLV